MSCHIHTRIRPLVSSVCQHSPSDTTGHTCHTGSSPLGVLGVLGKEKIYTLRMQLSSFLLHFFLLLLPFFFVSYRCLLLRHYQSHSADLDHRLDSPHSDYCHRSNHQRRHHYLYSHSAYQYDNHHHLTHHSRHYHSSHQYRCSHSAYHSRHSHSSHQYDHHHQSAHDSRHYHSSHQYCRFLKPNNIHNTSLFSKLNIARVLYYSGKASFPQLSRIVKSYPIRKTTQFQTKLPFTEQCIRQPIMSSCFP